MAGRGKKNGTENGSGPRGRSSGGTIVDKSDRDVVRGAGEGRVSGELKELIRVSGARLEMRPIDSVVPYARNARTHDAGQIAKLRGSLRAFGFVKPLAIDEQGNLLAGHGILEAARLEGMRDVPCNVVTGLSEVEKQAYIIADNALGELSAWAPKMLELEVKRLSGLGFDTRLLGLKTDKLSMVEVDAYTQAAPGEGETAPLAEDDDYDGSVPETCPHKAGDVFRLGRHLLVCGDCTDPEIVNKFQRGGGANLLLTDPPYGVALNFSKSDSDLRARRHRTENATITNDDLKGDCFVAFLEAAFRSAKTVMAPAAGFYVWHADNTRQCFVSAIERVGWTVREVLVWNKNSFVLGRQDYQWKHEPCLYGWNEGGAHYWAGGRAQSTVLDFARPIASHEHPTMKPIPLFDRLIRNSCPCDGVVYDPFGGSGTTLLACEQNGRTCWMVELEPKYIQVIIDRWEHLTGDKAELISRTE